jgi:hypothetical protein
VQPFEQGTEVIVDDLRVSEDFGSRAAFLFRSVDMALLAT